MTKTPTEIPITDTAEMYAGMQVIEEALQLIDGALGAFLNRELVSSGEVTDVLLDVRSKLRQTDSGESKDLANKAMAGKANSSAPTALA